MKTSVWNQLSAEEKASALKRPFLSQSSEIEETVRRIIQDVRERGDAALRELTKKFDKVDIEQFRVTDEEYAKAETQLPESVLRALDQAGTNIRKFHAAQKPKNIRIQTMPGVECRMEYRPIEKAGLYVPGGTAFLPSTVLMLGIPAQIAGCREKVLCVPPDPTGTVPAVVLAAAKMCGIREIFKVGGAQAIAAMTYGTESIPKTDKIFGPGNAYVTSAKLKVSQSADGAAMDMPAGPSEVMVIADDSANPAFVSADLLSQAEHGALSQVVLVTTSETLLQQVQTEVQMQLETLPRSTMAQGALEQSSLILVENLDLAVEIANAYAPEHLILQTRSPETFVPAVRHAGSVFLGEWTPESVGDYASGTNHALPTYGWARTFGGVSLMSFMKTMTVQKLSRRGLEKIAPTVETLAGVEELEAHRRAVRIRLAP